MTDFTDQVAAATERVQAVLEAERAFQRLQEMNLLKSSYSVVITSALNSAMKNATHPVVK